MTELQMLYSGRVRTTMLGSSEGPPEAHEHGLRHLRDIPEAVGSSQARASKCLARGRYF